MNKKFSTLLASVLLASAFSVNAAADLKEGYFVRLSNSSSQSVGIMTDGTLLIENNVAPTTDQGGNFDAVNKQLWKVAKVTTHATTGQKTYQFINKNTGAYLALKLESDQKPAEGDDEVTSKNAAKVNPAGNKEWALNAEGNLYAFYKDSVYTLKQTGNKLYLVAAKKENNAAGIATTALKPDANVEGVKLALDAASFNTLMGLRGHNGMLNFNGKDVSDKETNILKNTKWKAVAGDNANYIYLTNGSTKPGYTNDMASNADGYIMINKKLYLQVDTAVHAGSDYFKLAVDTLGFEKYDAGTGYNVGTFTNSDNKKIDKHPFQLAQFAAEYYFANDSIALTAKNLPTKGTKNIPGSAAVLEKYTGINGDVVTVDNVTSAFTSAKAVVDKSLTIKKAYDELANAVSGWNVSGVQPGQTADFTSDKIAALGTALGTEYADYEAVNAYKNDVSNLKFQQAGYLKPNDVWSATAPTVGTSTTPSTDEGKKLNEAMKAWTGATHAADSKFRTTYFKLTNSGPDWTAVVSSDTEGEGIYLGATLIAVAEASTEANDLSGKIAAAKVWEYVSAKYSVDGFATSATTIEGLNLAVTGVTYFEATAQAALAGLQNAFNQYVQANGSATDPTQFASTQFTVEDGVVTIGSGTAASEGVIKNVTTANSSINDETVKSLTDLLTALAFTPATPAGEVTTEAYKYFYDYETGRFHMVDGHASTTQSAQVVMRKLSSATVLTVSNETGLTESEPKGYILPLIQPYATVGGDAKIATANYHFIQVKNKVNENVLKAASLENKYWAIDWRDNATKTTVSEVSEYNPYTQWAFVEGSTGAYSIINRATGETAYSGALYKVADVENTYTNGTDTIKVAAVEIPESAVITEGDKKYDVTGYFYAGKDEKLINRLFAINPVSPFMSQLAAQYNKDSLMILGDAADAPVWRLKEVEKNASKGYVIEGTAPLLQAAYQIYTIDADKNEYYLTLDAQNADDANGFILTKKDSKLGDKAAKFRFISMGKDQYVAVATGYNGTVYGFKKKMTINPTPAKPVLEASDVTSERNDLFTFTQVNQNVYRTLVDEDGVLGNAKIYMENEPNRYLYENTANIVANNGKGLNFLGIYNTAELTKNAAMFIDTAYVNREDNLMPQYMLGLNVTTVPAQDAVACTYEHNHYDNAGNKVDAEHCSHATPATFGYKTGRYLVALSDSVPENGSSNSPVYYDGKNVRLAFVDAIHYLTQDTVVIKKSKYTGNSKQQVAGKEKTWAAKDTLAITGDGLNAATFALKYKDQATKSFYLESKGGKYVRILNGVPVLTASTEDAAVFNIEATTEEATANEAIEAAGVQVVAGKGTVTVQGAAGKVITVADILGRTIANQVAASDNVTIAAPAGVVVVAVDGDATKVVVK